MTARLFARLARAHSLFTCAIARVWDVCAPRFLARLRGRDARASFARAIVRVWACAPRLPARLLVWESARLVYLHDCAFGMCASRFLARLRASGACVLPVSLRDCAAGTRAPRLPARLCASGRTPRLPARLRVWGAVAPCLLARLRIRRSRQMELRRASRTTCED